MEYHQMNGILLAVAKWMRWMEIEMAWMHHNEKVNYMKHKQHYDKLPWAATTTLPDELGICVFKLFGIALLSRTHISKRFLFFATHQQLHFRLFSLSSYFDRIREKKTIFFTKWHKKIVFTMYSSNKPNFNNAAITNRRMEKSKHCFSRLCTVVLQISNLIAFSMFFHGAALFLLLVIGKMQWKFQF